MQGWRWAYILPAIPGFFIGLLILLTVREPERGKVSKPQNIAEDDKDGNENVDDDDEPLLIEERPRRSISLSKLKEILKPFMSPSLILLCIAGSIRNAGKYTCIFKLTFCNL